MNSRVCVTLLFGSSFDRVKKNVLQMMFLGSRGKHALKIIPNSTKPMSSCSSKCEPVGVATNPERERGRAVSEGSWVTPDELRVGPGRSRRSGSWTASGKREKGLPAQRARQGQAALCVFSALRTFLCSPPPPFASAPLHNSSAPLPLCAPLRLAWEPGAHKNPQVRQGCSPPCCSAVWSCWPCVGARCSGKRLGKPSGAQTSGTPPGDLWRSGPRIAFSRTFDLSSTTRPCRFQRPIIDCHHGPGSFKDMTYILYLQSTRAHRPPASYNATPLVHPKCH